MNLVVVMGNIGKDPEIKQTPTGRKVARFTLATSETYKKDDKKETKTIWHNIVAWGKQAEFCEKYLKKGTKILVQGSIDNRSYDTEGGTKYISEIIADKIAFAGGKGESKPQENIQHEEIQIEDIPF